MDKSIIIYSTPTCPYCRMAKEFLNSKNVAFKDVNVGADREGAKEMMKKSGQMGVPVLDINGKIIVGFDKDAIEEAINK